MSKFDTSPTRLIRSKNQPEKNKPAAQVPTEKISSSAQATEKIDVNSSSERGAPPTVNIQQESVDFRPEVGAIAGGNLNNSAAVESVAAGSVANAEKRGNKTVLLKRSSVATETAEKPIVGWLVVIEGKGKGRSIFFSYGLNKIGRDTGQDIALSFGDDLISRENHASIEFDPKTREFYLSKGENLVYLNEGRVGAGAEKVLEVGDKISLGDT
ncbi:MAG: FHA domain-containing protein, partial [Methyloprofundus sp.]|nr:FHA domain-containing protein [Methyloprofundus sp.]